MCSATATTEHKLYILCAKKPHIKCFDLQSQALTLGSNK